MQDNAYENEHLKSTLNNMGYATKEIDNYSAAFVDYVSLQSDPCLEVGAAFGTATLAALKQGAHIVANDLDARHLAFIEEQASQINAGTLELRPGKFPEDLNFSENSLSAILICRVLHFLPGDLVKIALDNCYRWLKPGGKLFIVVDSIYHGLTKPYLDDILTRKAEGKPFPGQIDQLSEHISPKLMRLLPEMMNFFDEDILRDALEISQFSIEKMAYFPRHDYSAAFQMDGREGLGVIAHKPIDAQL